MKYNISATLDHEELIHLIRNRAQNIFLTHQLMCAEAVLTSINRGLGGGLSDEMAIRMASGFSEGLSGSGCLCGALSGGLLALGLFLGRDGPGLTNRRKIAERTRSLHDVFTEKYQTTCCRMLTKGVKQGSRAHLAQCAELTGFAAEMAARIILEDRPALSMQADLEYLNIHDSRLRGRIHQVLRTRHP